MKSVVSGFLAVLVAGLLNVSFVGAVNTNNFTITDFNVELTLSRDSEKRSTLKTVETITAQFPEYDQNHGLERVFVTEYNGHPTSFKLESVTDENGVSLQYHWSDDVLRIGSANTYVHGLKTYKITYTQRDVTRYYGDTGKDEFYWDAIGLDWQPAIKKASVELSIDGSLKGHSSQPYCYQGASGSNEQCTFKLSEGEQEQPGEQTPLVYTADIQDIGSGKGVTVAVGFQAGTFAEYKKSLAQVLVGLWWLVQGALLAVAAAVVTWISIRRYMITSRKKEIGTIVPEYLPPKDTSVTASARTAGYVTSVMTAQLLDLAVRHYIKIYEAKEKTLFSPAEYEIEVIKDTGDLRWEEQELLRDTFGETPAVGRRLNLKKLRNSTSYYRRTLNNDTDLDKLIRGEYGLKHENLDLKKWLRRVALVLLIVSGLLLSPVLLVTAGIAFVMSFAAWQFTDKGLELKRYLEGLKMYIKVAEEERLKMLQSPEGAEKVASVAKGTGASQLVKLYEKVLPYAVLFGQEKEWNKQLGVYYENAGTQPDWYKGQTAFNAVMFSSAMSSFDSANNYASSSSSSTGGSSGGGSAGGGGGGGGGGGW